MKVARQFTAWNVLEKAFRLGGGRGTYPEGIIGLSLRF
jgi:hypothetical protein